MKDRRRSILFGVTSSESLKLLGNLPNRLAMSGWEVHVIAGPPEVKKGLGLKGVQHHWIPMKRKPSFLQDFLAFHQWFKLISEVRPEIVSIGTPKASLLGLTAARIAGVRTRVYVLRGLRLETSRGMLRAFLLLAERFTASQATQIIAVSPSLRELYLAMGLSDPEKVGVLGLGSSHGVNVSLFNRERWKNWSSGVPELEDAVRNCRPVIAFVGRFSEDKGASTLVACRKFLFESGIDHELVVMGPIEDSKNLLSELNKWGRPIILLGAVPNPAPFYSKFDAVVLPTKREGFPNVALEAAASSLPIVVTTATGAIDAVIPNQTGLIAKLGQDEDFAKAIRLLILEPLEASRMGQYARIWAARNFDEAIVEEFAFNFFENLLDGPIDGKPR